MYEVHECDAVSEFMIRIEGNGRLFRKVFY